MIPQSSLLTVTKNFYTIQWNVWIFLIIIQGMAKISISLAQMHIELAQPEANLEQAITFIRQAAQNSDLVLLPELWSSGYDLQNASRYIETNRSILGILADLARTEKIVIGGSLLEAVDGHYFNTFYLIDSSGQVIGTYRKIHLFRLMHEDRWLHPGDRSEMVDFAWGKTGMAICYDLRFPELFRHYALSGTRLVFLPSEWPAKRIHHWRILLQARAIENQMYIAAVNCAGNTGQETFGGFSAIVSPWGEVLVEGDGQSEALLAADVDFDEVERVRQIIPVFQDRRPDLYRLSNR